MTKVTKSSTNDVIYNAYQKANKRLETQNADLASKLETAQERVQSHGI